MRLKYILSVGLIVSACTSQQAPAPFSHQGNKVFHRNGESKIAHAEIRNQYGDDRRVSYIDSNESAAPATVSSRPLAPVTYNHQPMTSKYDEKVRISSDAYSPRPKPIIDDSQSTEYASISNDSRSFTPQPKPMYDRPIRAEQRAEIARVEQEYASVPRAPEPARPIIVEKKQGDYLDLSKVKTFGTNSKLSAVRPMTKPEYNEIETAAGLAPSPKPAPTKATEIAKKAVQTEEVKVAAISIEPAPIATKTTTDFKAGTNSAGAKFIKPLDGEIISNFGDKSDGTFNDGINIVAAEGTPVKAASGGSVVYSGNQLQGYGNLVIVRHDDGYLTAYAHLKSLDMQKGAQVKQGDVIGHVGKSGNVDKPQLHFGVRKGREPVNPTDFL